jgi:methyl-accepting chemotaxis protein
VADEQTIEALRREVSRLGMEIERRRLRRTKTMDSLEHVVATIAKLTDVMRRVAINATIEAARAGEHGAPFSVVASEIKSLASSMRAATEEASSLLKDKYND